MKRRIWKRLGVSLGILLGVLLVAAIATPMLLDLNRYHGLIVSEVQSAVGGKVTLGRITWGIRHRIWLDVDGFSIVGATAFPGDIELARIHASVSIPQLLAGKVVVDDLALESSALEFKLEPAAAGPPATDTPYTGIDLPVEIEIQKLTAAVTRLTIDDALSIPGQTLEHVFSDIHLAASNIAPAEVMIFNLSFRDNSTAGLGTLKAQGSFSGLTRALTLDDVDLTLSASLDDFHVNVIKPYLGDEQLSRRLDGIISTKINYQGDLGENLSARGTIDLSRLAYSDPALWETAIPGQSTTIAFQIKLDPRDLTAERVDLTLGALSLNAQTVLHDWNDGAVLRNTEISSTLPLRDVMPLVPWKLLGEYADDIRAVLEQGGNLELDKLTLADIELANPPATAPAWISALAGSAKVAGVSIQAVPEIPTIENINATVRLADSIVDVQELKGRTATVDLPPISASISHLLEDPKIDLRVQGPLKLNANADAQFQKWLQDAGLEELTGTADVDVTVGLDTSRPSDFQLRGNIELADFRVKPVYTPAVLHGLEAKVSLSPTEIEITRASAAVVLPMDASPAEEQFTMNLQGRIVDWQGKPSVAVRDFKTSRISLPRLSSMVPWEKLDNSTIPVKDTLDAGGYIAIETLSFPAVELAELSENPKQLLSRLKLATHFSDITVTGRLSPVEIQGITGRIAVADNVLLAENVHSRLGPIALPSLHVRATDIAAEAKVALRATGPLRVAASGDEQIKKLLLEHGLQSLSIATHVDVSADFDQHKPEQWTASGSVRVDDARAKSHPAGVVLEDIKGRLTFNRTRTMDIIAENITARINRAPVRLSGRILDIGSPGMLVSTTASARELELSDLTHFVPALKEMKLEGVLDMDVKAHIPYAQAEKTRLQGSMSARGVGLQLNAPRLAASKGKLEIRLSGDRADIKSFTVDVNDQKLALSGHLSNPVAPRIDMLLTSPDLNFDRLLSPNETAVRSSPFTKSKQDREPVARKTSARSELPPALKNLSAELKARIDHGQYKGLDLDKLRVDLSYEHGVLEHYILSGGINKGRIAAKGTADLRNLDRIAFKVEPDIGKLPLDSILPAFGLGKLPMEGPLTLTGQLRGHTGTSNELLESLDGNLSPLLGPGHVNKVGWAGRIVAKLSAMTTVSNLFAGRLYKDLANQGIPYESLTAKVSVANGNLTISELHFSSEALVIDGGAELDLRDMNVKMKTILVPLARVDEALDYVPLVGVALDAATKVQITIDGPLKHPKIHTAEFEQFKEGVGSAVESIRPKTLLEESREGLEKVF